MQGNFSGMKESEGLEVEVERARPYIERSTVVVSVEVAIGCEAGASAAVEGLTEVAPKVEVMVLRPVLEGVVAAEVKIRGEERCLCKLMRSSLGRVTESAGEEVDAR